LAATKILTGSFQNKICEELSREGREGAKDFLWTKILTRAKSIYEWRWITISAANLNVKRMSKKITLRVVLLLVAAFGIFVVYSVISVFIPRHGTVTNISDLQKVYSKGGSQVAATFTNSLIQKFPFDGVIDWKLILFKEPMMFLTGRVDTNALHQFISDHSTTKFLWSGSGGEVEEGWPSVKDYPTTTWTNIFFDAPWVVEGYEADIHGTIDFQSRTVTIRSSGSDEPVNSNK
jgi:hypothetical protein